MQPDKYIRGMIKDSQGYIWSGGFYNLKCFDLKDNSVRLYPGVSSITAIAEKIVATCGLVQLQGFICWIEIPAIINISQCL